MKTTDLNRPKTPNVIVNKNLNKLRGKEFFPEKLKKMNDILRKSVLPKMKDI